MLFRTADSFNARLIGESSSLTFVIEKKQQWFHDNIQSLAGMNGVEFFQWLNETGVLSGDMGKLVFKADYTTVNSIDDIIIYSSKPDSCWKQVSSIPPSSFFMDADIKICWEYSFAYDPRTNHNCIYFVACDSVSKCNVIIRYSIDSKTTISISLNPDVVIYSTITISNHKLVLVGRRSCYHLSTTDDISPISVNSIWKCDLLPPIPITVAPFPTVCSNGHYVCI